MNSEGIIRDDRTRRHHGDRYEPIERKRTPVDDGPVAAITVAYQEQDVSVFGWDLNWMVVYFALSLIFGFGSENRSA